ncbi:MarR family transcriptional regulator [Dactylosporangium sp. NPDC000244]|uniref:MarR family winged helix-turn-helix transcriptional regulator n=1 Tax=Dactylosporangium sp. NPDC000244 TaxID=3154365 RepID=UPI0033289285
MSEDDIDRFRDQVKALYQRMRREQPAIDGLPRSALQVLTAADNAQSPMRPGQLTAQLHMTSPNMAAALRELEAHGLITREPDPADKRQKFVYVTEIGHRVVVENRDSRHAWLRDAIERSLTSRERALLFQAGEIMQRLADDGQRRTVITMPPRETGTDAGTARASLNGRRRRS